MMALKKMIRCGVWIILVLVVVVAAAHLILPSVVNTDPVKEKIRARVQAAVRGQFDYAEAKPGILPRPHVAITNARLSIPGRVDMSAASLSVSLRLLPLLTGKVQFAALSLQSPVVDLLLPAAKPWDALPEQPMTRDALRQKAAAVLDAFGGQIKDSRLLVKNGRLALIRGADQIALDKLDLELDDADGILGMEVQGRSSAIDQFSAKTRIDRTSLDGSGRLDAKGMRPGQFMAVWLPEKKMAIPDAELDIGLTFETQGLETWRTLLDASIAEVLQTPGGGHVMPQVELKSSLSLTPDQVDITLSRLDIKTPGVQLSGSLLWQFGSAETDAVFQAALQANTIDLTAVRQAVITRLGRTPVYLQVVRGGVVSQLHAASRAASWSGLIDADNLVISGEARDGAIRIPGPDMALSAVSGRFTFARGILAADQASARLETTAATKGRLAMDLMAMPPTLDLTVDLDADLSQLTDLIKKFVSNPQTLAELKRISITQGRAVGTLALSGDLDHLDVTADTRDISLTLEDQRLPSALTLTGEVLSYSKAGIGFKNMGARLMGSSLSRLSGKLTWDPVLAINLQDAGADLICQELYPLLKSAWGRPLPAMAPKILAGRIVVANAAIIGPLANPRKWQFKAGGHLIEIKPEADILPGPLILKKGQFSIDPDRFAVSDLAIQWLDATLNISVGMTGYQTDSPLIELKTLKGDIGDRATTWIHQRFALAEELRPHTPVSIKAARGRWHRDEGVQFQADLMWPGDLNISLAMSAANHEMNLDHMRISDEQSDASLNIRYNSEAGELDLGYKGHLDKTSLAKLWQSEEYLIGGLDGDFSAFIKVHAPQLSVLTGQLDARQCILAVPGLESITINEAHLRAHDQRLDIHTLDLAWLQQQVRLTGDVEFGGDFFKVNLALLSDALDLNIIKKRLTTEDGEKEPPTTAAPQRPRPKVQGSVKLDIGSLRYDHYIFQPLQGELILQAESAVFKVDQASLCGLTTEGRIELAGRDLSVDLRPFATGQTLQFTGGCLADTPSTERYEGAYQMDGRLSSRGQNREELIQNLNGRIQFNVTDGRIQNVGRVGFFTNLLDYLRLNNLVSGKTPDLHSRDFLFKSLSLQLDINQGDIALNEAYLDSNALNLVAEGVIHIPTKSLRLNVLVSPLTTVDTVVRHIPIVGKILQGALVAVPVGVRGDIADPDIIPLSPGAIGSRLTGILSRTLKAPFQLIDPGSSASNGTSNQEGSGSGGEQTNAP